MKTSHFIILFVSILISCNLGAQDSFNYSVIEDNPDAGNKLYAGIGFFPVSWPVPTELEYKAVGQIGLELNSYNIYDRFSLNINSYFQSGISFYNRFSDRDIPNDNATEKLKYNKSNLTITTELFSYTKTKCKPVNIRNTSSVKYVSYIDQKVKKMFGLRLGYGFANLPFRSATRIDYLSDSTGIFIYGVQQHTLNLGLSFTNLINLHLMTDLFDEVKNKSIKNYYFDAIYLVKNKGYYYNKKPENPIDYDPSETNNGISFRIGYEKFYNYPKTNIPLAVKYGFEIIKHEFFDINSFNSRSIYLQVKFALLLAK